MALFFLFSFQYSTSVMRIKNCHFSFEKGVGDLHKRTDSHLHLKDEAIGVGKGRVECHI